MSHAAEFDEYGHKDHGHVIVSIFTLRFVLIALLACTLATSGAAWAENSIAEIFHVEIPQWINAAVALSIAVLKTTLVVMFFMQLKYDNPMNTIIFVFTILTVFSFLGFTSLDLNNRATIDRFKNEYAYDGGDLMMGGSTHPSGDNNGESIVDRAKRVARENGTYDPHHEHHAEEGLSITDMGYLPPRRETDEHVRLSTSNASRPVTGVTLQGLPGYRDPKAHHAHAEHAAPEGEHALAGDKKPGETPDHKTEAEPKSEAKPADHAAPRTEPPKPH